MTWTPLRADLVAALRIRRHAVPRSVIEKATERRLAGDWRGACAAANLDVAFELDDVADRFGAELASRLADDLPHFAPDLLRWHLPRAGGGQTTIAPRQVLGLARYGGGARAAALQVVTPRHVHGPQRPRLVVLPWSEETRDWTSAPHMFDARRSGDLLKYCGGGDRAPFFHPDGTPLAPEELPASPPEGGPALHEWAVLAYERGDVEAAFDAVGIDFDLTGDERYPRWLNAATYASAPVAPALLAREIARHPGGPPPLWVAVRPYQELVVRAGGKRTRPLLRPVSRGERAKRAVELPEHRWRRLPDLDLLRAGMATPDELHPLVAAALFPARPPASGPPGMAPPAPTRVRCGGEWHEVMPGGLGLLMPHTAEERRSEAAPPAPGGRVQGCFAVQRMWRRGGGWLPRSLREYRREVFLCVQHGDTEAVLRLLDEGLDPFVRDGRRRTLLHQIHLMDHEALLPRLLGAGLGLEDVDHEKRTPLHVAVGESGSPEVVRALVEAGARTGVRDSHGRSLQKMIKGYGRTELEWLRDEPKR
ncbi:ankyrin repeat domain-containing protein [Actinomadura litoris]|uniref:Ankyrin repeat domain-containing protein n=1 Tax=Actinomadura litoris TaxID=2678616 RepID=A0A7K1KWH7_9ACTN|nr:ankyrin repeat domain-containing protein [Actinomadura litoris]MUN36551.1 ankyrin repeat domain-containing protein [Actinomadura litoris]